MDAQIQCYYHYELVRRTSITVLNKLTPCLLYDRNRLRMLNDPFLNVSVVGSIECFGNAGTPRELDTLFFKSPTQFNIF